jgi:hypothetical protein
MSFSSESEVLERINAFQEQGTFLGKYCVILRAQYSYGAILFNNPIAFQNINVEIHAQPMIEDYNAT